MNHVASSRVLIRSCVGVNEGVPAGKGLAVGRLRTGVTLDFLTQSRVGFTSLLVHLRVVQLIFYSLRGSSLGCTERQIRYQPKQYIQYSPRREC